PFIAFNCGAISPTLIESEIFGHEKGAFTNAIKRREGYFELAKGGTVFLDEITEMPIELQVKLLRVLEEGKFRRVGGNEEINIDARIIAASNRDPQKAIVDCLPDKFLGARKRRDKNAVQIPLGQPMEEVERIVIEETLNMTDGDRRKTAEILGISYKTLYNKTKKYKSTPDDEDDEE